MPLSATVHVPATTANIGPGFDCLGAALTLYNRFQFTAAESGVTIQVTGSEAARVNTDETNLAYRAFQQVYQHLGQAPIGVAIQIELGVPLARGLGSSSTAIVGGLLGANALAGSPLSPQALMDLAVEIEGHPDNVVPALQGGCQLAVANAGQWTICPVPWDAQIVPIVAIPNFELSTAEARRVLPSQYSRADAIYNTAHLGLLLRALETGNTAWLAAALGDRIHQPYRQSLIRGYDAVQAAAMQAGAWGVVISGAGPTMLALGSPETASAIAEAMSTTWRTEGIEVEALPLSLDTQGAWVE